MLTDNPTGLTATAYKGDGKYVVVLVNSEDLTIPDLSVSVDGGFTSAVAYTTSLLLNMDEEALTKHGEGLIIDVQPKSVMTIVIME